MVSRNEQDGISSGEKVRSLPPNAPPNYGKMLVDEWGILPELSSQHGRKIWEKTVKLYEEVLKLRALPPPQATKPSAPLTCCIQCKIPLKEGRYTITLCAQGYCSACHKEHHCQCDKFAPPPQARTPRMDERVEGWLRDYSMCRPDKWDEIKAYLLEFENLGAESVPQEAGALKLWLMMKVYPDADPGEYSVEVPIGGIVKVCDGVHVSLVAEPRRDEREQILTLIDELGVASATVEHTAEREDVAEFARIQTLGREILRGLSKVRDYILAARASAAPLKQTADFTEAIHIAKSNFLTRSDVGKQYVTGYTDCRNEIVKRLESASQPQTLQTPQECNCCTCGHPRGGHDYGLHTPCFSYGCDCKKYAASLPQPSAGQTGVPFEKLTRLLICSGLDEAGAKAAILRTSQEGSLDIDQDWNCASLPQPSTLECHKCGWTADEGNGQPSKINPAVPSAGHSEELRPRVGVCKTSKTPGAPHSYSHQHCEGFSAMIDNVEVELPSTGQTEGK